MRNIFITVLLCLIFGYSAEAVDFPIFQDSTPVYKVNYIRQDGSQFSHWSGNRYWTQDVATTDTMIRNMLCGGESKPMKKYYYTSGEGITYISYDMKKWRIDDTPIVQKKDPVSVRELLKESYNVYPNPTSGNVTLNITLSGESMVKLIITTLQGTAISEPIGKTISGGQHRIDFDLGGLPSGTYLYSLQINNNSTGGIITLVK